MVDVAADEITAEELEETGGNREVGYAVALIEKLEVDNLVSKELELA